MGRCYSDPMRPRHPLPSSGSLPAVWLVSDARNDSVLERALRRLPRGSGLIFRHYHLDPAARRRMKQAENALVRHLATRFDFARLAKEHRPRT